MIDKYIITVIFNKCKYIFQRFILHVDAQLLMLGRDR